MNKSVPRYDGNHGPYFYEEFVEFYQDIGLANRKWKNGVPSLDFYEDKSRCKSKIKNERVYNSKHIRIANSKKNKI